MGKWGREGNYRTFNGKKYAFEGSVGSKRDADKKAKKAREEGLSARVTPVKIKAGTYKGKTRYLIWIR